LRNPWKPKCLITDASQRDVHLLVPYAVMSGLMLLPGRRVVVYDIQNTPNNTNSITILLEYLDSENYDAYMRQPAKEMQA